MDRGCRFALLGLVFLSSTCFGQVSSTEIQELADQHQLIAAIVAGADMGREGIDLDVRDKASYLQWIVSEKFNLHCDSRGTAIHRARINMLSIRIERNAEPGHERIRGYDRRSRVKNVKPLAPAHIVALLALNNRCLNAEDAKKEKAAIQAAAQLILNPPAKEAPVTTPKEPIVY